MDARGAKIVTSACLQNLAGKMGQEWKNVGRRLGLEDADLHFLTRDSNEGQENTNYEMLATWKKKAADKASYKVLANALNKAGRLDLAQELLNGKFDDDMEQNIVEMPGSVVVSSGNDEVPQDVLLKLSGDLTHEWMDVGRYLGVPEATLDTINDENRRRKAAITEMFKLWKKLKGTKATYAALASSLRQAGRTDLAQTMPN